MKATIAIRSLILICLACWSASQTLARDDQPSATEKTDEALRRLLIARSEAATNSFELQRQKWESGKATMESVADAGLRMRDAMLELSGNHDEKVEVYKKQLALARWMEARTTNMVAFLPASDSAAARYWRLSAEIDLLRNQMRRPAAKAELDEKKLSERHEFQLMALEAEIKKFKPGESSLINLLQFARDLRDVELEMSNNQAQLIATRGRYAALIRAFEPQAKDALERASTAAERKAAEAELDRAKQNFQER